MYNRAEIVDKNFLRHVQEGYLPPARTHLRLHDVQLTPQMLLDLFESQVLSRHLDLQARILKQTGECFYTIGSSGHEGNAVFGAVFRHTDMAFLHYRSGALMIQRSKQVPGTTPIYDLLLSFTASTEDPIAGGRHKVLGSKELFIPPQTSTIASHLPKAVGMALSIGRCRDIGVQSVVPPDSLVICNFGDASANHASAQCAFNTAAWAAYQNINMPIVFICEDNRVGISVPTAEKWIERSFSHRPEIHYLKCDGLSLLDTYRKTLEAERFSRLRKKPVFLHMETVRLLGHAGSDVESTYHPIHKIEADEFDDPLLHSARIIIESNVLSKEEVIQLYEQARQRIASVASIVIHRPKLDDPQEVIKTLTACTDCKSSPPLPSEEKRKNIFGRDYKNLEQAQHMAKLINWGLTDILLQFPNTLIFGEDVAAKGGVYNVTDSLVKKFSNKRVFNSPLDETSIIGAALGMAHNGLLPIPEIQFLAYVHNAEDQIRGEASTLAFFSQGQYTNPMVLRIAGLAYQKGFGGHFHNDNSIAIFRDIPGLIIAIPSNGVDAVKMLRTCVNEAYQNGRVVIFIEPIALYMTRDLHTEGDKLWAGVYPAPEENIKIGEFATYGQGEDLLVISYGNGYYYSRKAMHTLENEFKVHSTIVDLRWIAPFDKEKLLALISQFDKVLIVDECRKTGSFSEQICAAILEELENPPRVKIVAADDCFIPLGIAAAAGLPNENKIIQAAKSLLGDKL
ncbi:MAG: hypothetical protein KDD40_00620 [Bdellovibrionales bacterium]|nr:hypothetical protein [Bdellovibrionales bacterium]